MHKCFFGPGGKFRLGIRPALASWPCRLSPFVSLHPVTPCQKESYTMTTLTAPAPQANIAANTGEQPINLFQLGCRTAQEQWHRTVS